MIDSTILRGFGGPLKKYNVLKNLPRSQGCCPAKAITSLRDNRDDARLTGLYVIRGNCFGPRKSTFSSVLVEQLAAKPPRGLARSTGGDGTAAAQQEEQFIFFPRWRRRRWPDGRVSLTTLPLLRARD